NQAGDNAGTTADHPGATVAGGMYNTAAGQVSTVSGGSSNVATGITATVGGGGGHIVGGNYSTIPGGLYNTVVGANSFAAGYLANVTHDGTFVWCDVSSNDTCNSGGPNQFGVRSRGGVYFDAVGGSVSFVNVASAQFSFGCFMHQGDPNWSCSSDR